MRRARRSLLTLVPSGVTRMSHVSSNMYDFTCKYTTCTPSTYICQHVRLQSTTNFNIFVFSVDPKVLSAADLHELDNMEEAGFFEVVHMLDIRAKVPYALIRQVMVFHGLVPFPQKVQSCLNWFPVSPMHVTLSYVRLIF